MTTEMDIFQDIADDPATLTSQLFGMPCKSQFNEIYLSSQFTAKFVLLVTADDYQVLSTDYTNYAVEYRCEDRGLFQRRGIL